MAMMQKGVALLSDRMPKVVSPKTHAIADFVTLGGLALLSALLWNRNRRAAVTSLACAGAEAANVLLTDFPGGITDKISFPTHLKVDMGIAAMCSAAPNFGGFYDEPEAQYFRALGMGITVLASLTNPKPRKRMPALRRIA